MDSSLTPRSPPARPGRRWLLIAGLAALILGLPIAYSVGQVVANALQPYGGVLAAILIGFVALAGLAALRIAFAYGRRLEAQAKQAEIVQLQNGQPIHVLDVSALAARMAPHTLDRHYDVEQARAERASLYPNLANLHQTMHGAPPALVAPASALVLPVPSGGGTLPDLAEAITRGASSPDRWLAGYDAGGEPQQIVLKHAGFIAISGVQGTGKTNTAALLAAQAAAHGGYLFIADPHYGDDESLAARIAPFSGAVERFAVTPDEINEVIGKVDRIYARRSTHPNEIDQPVVLIIDEFMELMIRGQLGDQAIQSLLALSGGGRKKQVFCVLISQNWSQRLLGQHGVAVRQNVTHVLAHRSSAETADFLLPSATFARQAATAQPGQLVFFGGGEPAFVTVQWLSDADLRLAARGRPQRQYTPRGTQATGAPAPIPPTTRVAAPRPVPPTERLPEPTIPKQIELLLTSQARWLTSSEIASALGLDLKAVRTALTPMERQRKIIRRETRRNVPETYEYASQSVNQPSTMTLTA